MKTFFCLIRVNPAILTASAVSRLGAHWETSIRQLLKHGHLKEISIFREPGVIIRREGPLKVGYDLNAEQLAITGFLQICCDQQETALDLCQQLPTFSLEGTIEIREVLESKNFA